MKYKSSAYTGFMQHTKINIPKNDVNRLKVSNRSIPSRPFLLGRYIFTKWITLLNSNAEEESHFFLSSKSTQYKFLKTYTTSLFQQFYDSSLNSFIPKRSETSNSRVK